jgi:hypothetical protein
MTIAQKKKSSYNNQKRRQREAKEHTFVRDNSVSCKAYKQKKKEYRELTEA